jgi:hypothetical protein
MPEGGSLELALVPCEKRGDGKPDGHVDRTRRDVSGEPCWDRTSDPLIKRYIPVIRLSTQFPAVSRR